MLHNQSSSLPHHAAYQFPEKASSVVDGTWDNINVEDAIDIPPAAFESPEEAFPEEQNSDGNGEDEEDNCNCGCDNSPLEEMPYAIIYYDLYNDSGTPEDKSDDIFVGTRVEEVYRGEIMPRATNYDTSGNQADYLDYDYAVPTGEISLGGGITLERPLSTLHGKIQSGDGIAVVNSKKDEIYNDVEKYKQYMSLPLEERQRRAAVFDAMHSRPSDGQGYFLTLAAQNPEMAEYWFGVNESIGTGQQEQFQNHEDNIRQFIQNPGYVMGPINYGASTAKSTIEHVTPYVAWGIETYDYSVDSILFMKYANDPGYYAEYLSMVEAQYGPEVAQELKRYGTYDPELDSNRFFIEMAVGDAVTAGLFKGVKVGAKFAAALNKTKSANSCLQIVVTPNTGWQSPAAKAAEELADAPFAPGSVGAAKTWTSIKSRLKAAQLPTSGRIRFVPVNNYNATSPLLRGPNGGYVDRFGNEWVRGPSRTAGEPFEWDVQLSNRGKEMLGWLSRDGKHVNISLGGHLTH